jgi:hypothetical protein
VPLQEVGVGWAVLVRVGEFVEVVVGVVVG